MNRIINYYFLYLGIIFFFNNCTIAGYDYESDLNLENNNYSIESGDNSDDVTDGINANYVENENDFLIIVNDDLEVYSDFKNLRSLFRFGRHADYVDGHWFIDMNSIYTYNSGDIIGFNFPYISGGNYEVRILGKYWTPHHSGGKKPEGFEEYKIQISTDYNDQELIILPVSALGWKKGTCDIYVKKPGYIYLTWLNQNFGVNFQLHSIKLKKK